MTSVPHPCETDILPPCAESRHLRSSRGSRSDESQPEITVTQHHSSSDSSSLAPLVEHEGEAYLEKAGGVRRHTVANVQSDMRLLSASGKMCTERDKDGGAGFGEGGVRFLCPRPFSSEPDVAESPRGGVIC